VIPLPERRRRRSRGVNAADLALSFRDSRREDRLPTSMGLRLYHRTFALFVEQPILLHLLVEGGPVDIEGLRRLLTAPAEGVQCPRDDLPLGTLEGLLQRPQRCAGLDDHRGRGGFADRGRPAPGVAGTGAGAQGGKFLRLSSLG